MSMNMIDIFIFALFALAVVFCVCFFSAWAWGIVFLFRTVRVANRMGASRHGCDKNPDLGMRLTNRKTPSTVMLLLLMHAYVHPDKQIRAFGEFALRFLRYQPRLVFVSAIVFEAMFFQMALISLLGALAAFLAGPDNWLVGAACLIPSILIIPVFLYTLRANGRRRRLLARLLTFSKELQERRIRICRSEYVVVR